MGLTVLVVDDDPNTVRLIEDSIPWSEYGIDQVYSAYQGAQALELVAEHEPDIVISDIEMPQMDGLRLTKLVKSDKEFQHIPLVIFSSLITEEMRRKGKELGADEQMSKPEIGHLVQVIDHLLDHPKR